MEQTKLVLGIDAGIASCGFALVMFRDGGRECLAAGTATSGIDREIEPDRKRDDVLARAARLAAQIQDAVRPKLRTLGARVDVLAIEDVVAPPNRNTQHACSCTVGTLGGVLGKGVRHVALLRPDEVKETLGLGARGQKMDKAWVEKALRPHHVRAAELIDLVEPAQRNHAWDAVAAAEAVVFLRAEWFDGIDPWKGGAK